MFVLCFNEYIIFSDFYLFIYPEHEVGKIRKFELDTKGLANIAFGKQMRQEFCLDPNTTFLNHGSYGAVPKRVLDLQNKCVVSCVKFTLF